MFYGLWGFCNDWISLSRVGISSCLIKYLQGLPDFERPSIIFILIKFESKHRIPYATAFEDALMISSEHINRLFI